MTPADPREIRDVHSETRTQLRAATMAAHVAVRATTPPAISAYTMAIVGLASWALSTYAFPHGTPGPVTAALYTLAPAIVGYVSSHISWHIQPPGTPPAPPQGGGNAS